MKKIKVQILTLWIIINSSYTLYSNVNIDSLQQLLPQKYGIEKIDILNILSYEYSENNPDKAIEYGNLSLKLSEESKYGKGIAKAQNNIGRGFYYKNNFDVAIEYYQKALAESEALNNKKEIGRIYNNFGVLYYTQNQFEKALSYYEKALKVEENIDDAEFYSIPLNNIGILYFKWGNLDKALEYRKKLLQIKENSREKKEIADVYNAIGLIYFEKGEHNTALDYYLKEIKLREEIGDNKKMDIFLSNIGKIYYALQKYDKAINYYQKALESIRNDKNKSKAGKIYTSIGNVYYDWKKYDKALQYYQYSLEIAKNMGSKKGIAVLLNNIGLVYKNLGNYRKALEYCKKSLELKEELNDKSDLFYPLTSIAEINIKLGDYNQALEYLFKALQMAQYENQKKLIKESYYLLYEVYSYLGNYKSALDYHKYYTALKDSLMNEEFNKKYSEYLVKYETDKKEIENKLLLKTNEIQRNYFIIISCLTVVLLLVLYNRYRNKHKANQILNQKNLQIQNQHQKLEETYSALQEKEIHLVEANATKDKFFTIIAHDLKNPLQGIILSSELLVNKFKYMNGEQLLELIKSINKAGSHLSNLLENLLEWSRTQTGKMEFNPKALDIKVLFDENINLMKDVSDKKSLTITNEIAQGLNVIADYYMTSTVVRNLISNAIKFTPDNGSINISAVENHDVIEISVHDTGIGISIEDLNKLFRIDVHHTTIGTYKEKGTGLGLILCKEFIEKNGGRIWVESQVDIGSTFKFVLPKSKQ